MTMHWIIDGINLLYRMPDQRRLLNRDAGAARQQLVSRLAELLGTPGVDDIVVVFDGRGDRLTRECPVNGLTVLYSPTGLTADAVIERWIAAAPDPARCRVVTSDRMERDGVRAAGAESMGCSEFIEWMSQQQQRLQGMLTQRRRQSPTPTLGDRFPGLKA